MKSENIFHLFINVALALSPVVNGHPINQPRLLKSANATHLSAFDFRAVVLERADARSKPTKGENMKRLIQLLPAVLLACLNGFAQQPTFAFTFSVIAQPGMVIGGHTFTPKTTIDSVALNDAGEVAFIARWASGNNNEHAAIFTSQRLVVSEGDVVEGKFIALIAKNAGIAINFAGQVAYEAWYTTSKEEVVDGTLGIFIDNHLAFTPNNLTHTDFLLTDDGWVIPRHRTFSGHQSPFPNFPTNAQGQIVLSLNLKPSGFLLLLGTPLTSNKDGALVLLMSRAPKELLCQNMMTFSTERLSPIVRSILRHSEPLPKAR